MTYLLMRDSGAKTDKQTDYGVWKHMYRRTCRWTRKQENKQTNKKDLCSYARLSRPI